MPKAGSREGENSEPVTQKKSGGNHHGVLVMTIPGPKFSTARAIRSEITDLEKPEQSRRQNRATVSNFFNGAPPYTQEEAQRIGLEMNVNNLFGFTALATAKGQLRRMFDVPQFFYEITLKDAPPGEKQRMEMLATEALNDIVKDSGRFKIRYDGWCGDAIMHGEGLPHFHSATDWCPGFLDLSQRLIPSEQEATVEGITHFDVITGLTFDQILFHLRRNSDGWDMQALKSAAMKLVEDKKTQAPELFTQDYTNNPEMAEYDRQAGVDSTRSSRLPVDYFYQVRYDLPGNPVDLTIISRVSLDESGMGKEDEERRVLYKGPSRYRTVNHAIRPIFMNCRLGGKIAWHRGLGLGHLNYSIAWHVEALMCRLMQCAVEDATMFWQVTDQGARETLEAIRLKHNGIIPVGAEPIQHRHQSNLQALVGVIEKFQQQGSQNIMGLGTNDGTKGDEFEVEALARQDNTQAQRSAHSADWYDQNDRIGQEIVRRFTNPWITEYDQGYSEIADFQARMERNQIPLRYLQPGNTRVRVTRIAGNGNQRQAAAEGAFILTNLDKIDPHKQAAAKRFGFAAVLGDYRRAAEFIDVDNGVSTSQVREAEEENAAMITRAWCGQLTPFDTTADDVHEQHLTKGHFPALIALISKGVEQKNSWDQDQMNAFQMIGAHCVIHINALKTQGKKDIEKAAMDQLNQLAAYGAKMANNLRQKQQQQEIDPVQSAKLQLDGRKVALQEHKHEFGQEKFDRTQALRERQAATSEVISMQKDNRDEHRTRQEMALEDVRTAAEI